MPTIFYFSKNVQIEHKNHPTLKPVVLSIGEDTPPSRTGEMRGCCVPLCKSNKKRDKISFHEMPSNEELREKWVEAIMKHVSSKNSSWYPDQYDLVCAKHFTDDDYRPTCSVRCLKSGAVPSMFPDLPECEEKQGSSELFEDEVLELDFEDIDHLRKSRSFKNLSGPSAFRPRSKNLKQIKKGQNNTEKGLLRTKKMKVKKQIISSSDFSDDAFSSQAPLVTHLSSMSSSRAADDDDDDVDPTDSMHTLVHHSPRLKRGTSLLSNEVICNGQSVFQNEIPETSDCVTAAGADSLMEELDAAQQEISHLQSHITSLKEQNVKLQWEKNSILVTHLHDIKRDAVDGNYEAIILLNRIVHYSLQRT